ncbi:ABC transporter permease subunit [Clostridium sp. 'White wine YQ']|uniref:ABC transporter permease subunit n=1 Tax=Clostridium sp. 'White wine YQ' TaxID=3027474 RepID=UPI0023673606|nr:ABC transporter permease subunit [Clostridium sp. 'White wine YQ']MDD7795149.1 ABC transporter permease subunit [Clostridium sp. 'White wine YQ']
MKKLNLPLIIGGIIIAVILILVAFPEKVTHYNPYAIEGIKTTAQKSGASISIQGAPFSPSKENILGTDQLGRDELSLLVYGTRLTLEIGILVVLGRFLIAIPLGIAAGFGNNLCKSIISLFNLVFSAIPALIISILVLGISFFLGLFKEQSILAFVIVLTIVGFGKVAGLVRERVENILSKPFITGERAIGKSNILIAVKNVLPHLSPELIVLIFMEMALALSMIMELGLFGAYVGNIRILLDGGKTLNISVEPEWASMISSSIAYISAAPWMVFSPAVAFFISIFSFNLFGEGLREMFSRKKLGSSVILKDKKKKFKKAAGVVIAGILLLFISNIGIGYYKDQATKKQAAKIMSWEFKNQVLIGSEEAKYTADNLKESLKEAGFQPIGQDYIQTYDVDKLNSAKEYSFTIKNGEESNKLVFGKDFALLDYKDYSLKGQIFKGDSVDMFNLKDYGIFDNKLVLFDEQTYSREAIKEFSNNIKEKSKALGVIDVLNTNDTLPSAMSSKITGDSLIYITKEASKSLENDTEIEINLKACTLTGNGRNVIGVLPGKNPNLSNEYIMISMGYNYFSDDRKNIMEKMKMLIETAKKLYQDNNNQGRSIIIAFWDGNLTEEYSGVKKYVDNPLVLLNKTVLNIDLTNMNVNGNTVVINSQQISVTKYFSWAFNHEFESKIKKNNMIVESNISKKKVSEIIEKGPNSKEVMYYKGAVPTILLLNKENNNEIGKDTIEKNFVKTLVSSISNINY